MAHRDPVAADNNNHSKQQHQSSNDHDGSNKPKKRIRLSPFRKLWMYVHLVAFVIYIFLVSVTMCCTIPLRLLHRPLRMLGVRSNWLPLDYLSVLWSRTFLLVCGVDVIVEGKENMDLLHPSVVMYTHVSNLDPIVLIGFAGAIFKLIGKKSVYRIPLFGWAGLGYGHIAIDRSNREKAIQSLDLAEYKCRKWQRSILISPEGTRSKTGELQEFKKGPFHVWRHLHIKATPIVLFKAWELWPPGQIMCLPGTMVIRILPSIPYDETLTLEQQQEVVRNSMLQALDNPPSDEKINKRAASRWWFQVLHYVSVFFFLSLPYLAYRRFF